ncbi:MAG: transcriptional regulator [Epulopiscium sp. Nuni2H_MBin003]|nr:MAG: transcriptional regulator [Epulopiscium sp. Nuni2H_MBin003]
MTFRQMEIFVAVCDNSNITKTSEEYLISQQSISKMIKELEIELDAQLLYRTTTGVTPTPKGAYFLEECRQIIYRKGLIYKQIRKIKDFTIETIRLGMAFGIISVIPYRLILEFEQQHPNIMIEYNDRADFFIERLLQKDEYDLALTTRELDSEIYISELLFSEFVYLCIPRTHSLYFKKIIEMQDLEYSGFAMFSKEFQIYHNFMRSCEWTGFKPNIIVSSNDFNSLREIATCNNLLFIVPEHAVNNRDISVRYTKFPYENFMWQVYFLRKKSKSLSTHMQVFYEYIKNAVLGF